MDVCLRSFVNMEVLENELFQKLQLVGFSPQTKVAVLFVVLAFEAFIFGRHIFYMLPVILRYLNTFGRLWILHLSILRTIV